MTWNSVMFIDYVDKPIEDDFKEPSMEGKKEFVLNGGALAFAQRKWRRENKEQIAARNMYKEGNTKLSESEIVVTSVRAYCDVNGTLRHNKDVMISYQRENETTVFDLFLTYDQAKYLNGELSNVINTLEND